jgi:Domain of unknown function (DUF1906)
MAVLDFAWTKPALPAVAAFVAPDGTKITGLAGYISYDKTGKNVEAPYIQAALAAGFDFSLIWETHGKAADGGAPVGAAEGRDASAMADARGYPADAAILFALADPTRSVSSEWSAIEGYIRAAKAAGHRAKVGGYGDQALVEHMLSIGAIDFAWQVGAWSLADSKVGHLCQQLGYVLDNTCDWNKVLKSEYGQWHANKEIDMTPDEHQYLLDTRAGVEQLMQISADLETLVKALAPAVGTAAPTPASGWSLSAADKAGIAAEVIAALQAHPFAPK